MKKLGEKIKDKTKLVIKKADAINPLKKNGRLKHKLVNKVTFKHILLGEVQAKYSYYYQSSNKILLLNKLQEINNLPFIKEVNYQKIEKYNNNVISQINSLTNNEETTALGTSNTSDNITKSIKYIGTLLTEEIISSALAGKSLEVALASINPTFAVAGTLLMCATIVNFAKQKDIENKISFSEKEISSLEEVSNTLDRLQQITDKYTDIFYVLNLQIQNIIDAKGVDYSSYTREQKVLINIYYRYSKSCWKFVSSPISEQEENNTSSNLYQETNNKIEQANNFLDKQKIPPFKDFIVIEQNSKDSMLASEKHKKEITKKDKLITGFGITIMTLLVIIIGLLIKII